MENREEHQSRDEGSAKLAVIVIRGVGEASANETISLLEPALAEHGIHRAREINWSWTEVV